MFAVIKTGGKQYKVSLGEMIRVEKIDAEPGAIVELDQVLLIGDAQQFSIGTPLVEGAKVEAKVVSQTRGEKIRVVKMRRRKDSRTQTGHRQFLTELEITSIHPGQ